MQERAGGLVGAHHRVAGRGPGQDQPGVVGLSAQRVIAGPERPANDHRQLRHHAIADHIDQLGPGG